MRLSLIALLLILSSSVAHAQGTFGIGLQLGQPTTFTGKYLFNADQGIAFHVGTHLNHTKYQHVRVQYEQRFVDFAKWRWGDLGMYFDVGGVLRSWDGHTATGPSGGVGLDMRFRKVPIIVFAELDVRVYMLGDHDKVSDDADLYEGVGARWYF